MAHLTVIKTLLRNQFVSSADAGINFDTIEDYLHTLPENSTAYTSIMTAVDELQDAMNDFKSDFEGRIAAILAMCE